MKLFYASLLLSLIISLIALQVVASRLPDQLVSPARIERSAPHAVVSGG